MKSTSRRNLAALISVSALAAGALAVTMPGAGATTINAQGGVIGLSGGSGSHLFTIKPDGTGLTSVPSIADNGITPGWAPDGTRVVAGSTEQLVTGRTTGTTSLVQLPGANGGAAGPGFTGPVYWMDGAYVISGSGGELFYGPSDGAFAPVPLLTGTQHPAGVTDDNPTTSPTGQVAFDRVTVGSDAAPDVWTFDPVSGNLSKTISDASSPVFSADGSTLVFVRVVDGHRQLFTAAADGTGITQVTTDAADHLHPTWDPAGGRIAYDVAGADSTTVEMLTLSDGSVSTVSTTGSNPSWQPLRKNTFSWVYASGSVTIDQAASRWAFDTVGKPHVPGLIPARSAVLVNKAMSTYSSPAISLAAEKQGPVIMSSGTSLDTTASAELKRGLPKGSTVYLVGGTNLINDSVANTVTALGYKVLRLGGADLTAVSARVALQITSAPEWVFLADGTDYHDPMSASAAAGALGYKGRGVVLLTHGTTPTSSVTNFLNSLDPATTNLVTVGRNARTALGTMPLTKDWEYWAIDGGSTDQTAVDLARFWWAAPYEAVVQDTWTWQNAAVGNASNATYGPVLWSTEALLSPSAKEYLTQESASVQSVQMFGPNASYSVNMRTELANAVANGNSWVDTHWVAGGVLPAAKADVHAAALTPAFSAPAATPVGGLDKAATVLPGRHPLDAPRHTTR
ncbi:PD40 domain-containing protein [Streptomyces sp. 150FB]|uniref:PD40 domain-containing protein n=1 Tax=Streptomyces sp. 150FB TaxID=1576605 RepID=UPI0006964283|nr:PD40 domain-containing protein [Streptomyces sp. 150FB]